jgi:predicted transcriptional regulator
MRMLRIFLHFSRERTTQSNNGESLMKKANSAQPWGLVDRIWKGFTQINRTVNAVCIITVGFLLASMVTNIALSLTEPLILNLVCIAILIVVYVLSRIYKMYRTAFGVYAFCCYVALITTFIYNDGMDGPAFMFFFLTFHLLIAISPKQQHFLWAVLHIVIGTALMSLEYFYEGTVQVVYDTGFSRYFDVGISYAVSLFFVYIITINLRSNYEREKNIVKRRTQQVAARSAKINEQNERLKDIAWVQSHKVRAHVATILGLADLINTAQPNDAANAEVLNGIKTAAGNLDEVIRDINTMTEKVAK